MSMILQIEHFNDITNRECQWSYKQVENVNNTKNRECQWYYK